jgi:hypothetical protein
MESLDEQSVPNLFQAANSRYLAPNQAVAVIRETPGLIPIAITQSDRLVWLDIGDCPLSEWKFRFSIRNLIERVGVGGCFATSLDLLQHPGLDLDTQLRPAGFIFHMSKCGSTLLSKILDQSPAHVVLKEPTPFHERFWRHLTDDWGRAVEPNEANLRMIRNLLQAMGRIRLSQQTSYFVRFRSWTVAFVETIQRAFPETPCLFMYRDPVEVMASILSKPTTGLPRLKESGAAAFITGCSDRELDLSNRLGYFTAFYKQYLLSGLTKMDQRSRYLNYRDLSSANLPKILEAGFQFSPPAETLVDMECQFGIYSKDDTGAREFTPDREEKRRLVTPAMRRESDLHLSELYQALEVHERNLKHSLPVCLANSGVEQVA